MIIHDLSLSVSGTGTRRLVILRPVQGVVVSSCVKDTSKLLLNNDSDTAAAADDESLRKCFDTVAMESLAFCLASRCRNSTIVHVSL